MIYKQAANTSMNRVTPDTVYSWQTSKLTINKALIQPTNRTNKEKEN